MNVVQMWGAMISAFGNDSLTPNRRYEDVVTSRLELAIGAKDLVLPMRKSTTATLEHFWLSQISSGPALHALLDKFAAIPRIVWIHCLSTFLIPSICTIFYFVSTVQDLADELCGIMLQNRFCTAAWW